MATDGSHQSGYDPALINTVLAEAAHLLRALGFAAHHTVLIGGVVPNLLVLDPPPGRPSHVGTGDLDLCLSMAIVEGDTAEYERIETPPPPRPARPRGHLWPTLIRGDSRKCL